MITPLSSSSRSKPQGAAPRVCVLEYAEPASRAGCTAWQSARIRSKTVGPMKTSAGATSNEARSAPPVRAVNGSGATTVPSSRSHVNQPVTACSAGERPVRKVVTAEAVVEGNTEVIVLRNASRNAGAAPDSSCDRPSPSMTRSTTCPAPAISSGPRSAR